MKIRKHRMWPLILIAIIITCMTVMLGAQYIAAVTIDNYQKENEDFDEAFERFSTLMEYELNDYSDSLHAFSLMLSNAYTNGQDSQIYMLLITMKRANQFEDLHIIKRNEVTDNLSDGLIAQSDGQLCFYSYIPASCGYLCGTVSLDQIYGYINHMLKEEVLDIYLLDSDKNPLLSMNNQPLAYNEIDSNDFYDENTKYDGLRKNIYSILDSSSTNDTTDSSSNYLSFKDLFTSIQSYICLSETDAHIWYEHPITVGDRNYFVLTAKNATFSTETIVTAIQASFIVGIIIFVCFVIWILFIIYQGISNRRLYHAAFIDPITNYNNAPKFRMDTNKRIKKHKKLSYALVLLDIDNFKIINDIYGYENGNGVLKKVSDSIRQQLFKKETCTRYAADEFMMLLTYEHESDIGDRIIKMNQYVLSQVNIPNMKFSYGVYFVQDYTLSVEQMSIYAGMAKDTIKGLKDQNIGYFNESIRQSQIRDKDLENAAEQAFTNKEFAVYLQPKYNAVTNKIGGAEALVRWISPTFGFISPGEFIPLFERNHMVIRLDNYMLEEVCRQQRKWLDEGKELVTISVNISRVHLTVDSLIEDVLVIVDSYQIPHQYIELELTESAFFDEKDKLLHVVSAFQQNGFLVSMDDFGSGYSSLNSLKDLPLDVIKLDGEFFRTTNNTERSETVIRDTISLAKHLQMKIVAEGVETKDQVDFLNGIGCDLIQGFYFAKPMPVADFEKKCYES